MLEWQEPTRNFSERWQHTEMYLLVLKAQDEGKMKLPLDMQVFSHFCPSLPADEIALAKKCAFGGRAFKVGLRAISYPGPFPREI